MAQEKQRYIYIDLLRGWAVVVMIEVHVVHALLLPELRTPEWFKAVYFINGLVAPSFLFVSGFSFVLVAQRKWNDYLRRTSVWYKQLGRIFQILAVGYLLHLPFFSLNRLLQTNWDDWSPFWKVDILHTISVSLLVMLAFIMAAKEQKKNFVLLVIIAIIIVFSAPFLYDRNIDHIFPEPIANYFTAAHQSQFPLFPWMGFVLCGGIAAQVLVWWKEKISEQKIFLRFIIFAAAAIVVSIAVSIIPFTIYPEHNYWRANPAFFFLRLGIVIALLALLWLWERKFQSGKSLISIIGSESLLAYAGHLLLLYGQFFDAQSVAVVAGKTLSYGEVLLVTIALIAVTIAACYVWHCIKNWSMFYARVLMYSLLSAAMFVFLSN